MKGLGFSKKPVETNGQTNRRTYRDTVIQETLSVAVIGAQRRMKQNVKCFQSHLEET